MSDLTPAQQRYLDDIRRDGERTYNGRAYRLLKVLEDKDLIEVDWFTGGYTPRELHTARPSRLAEPLGPEPCGHDKDALGHCLGSCQGEDWDR